MWAQLFVTAIPIALALFILAGFIEWMDDRKRRKRFAHNLPTNEVANDESVDRPTRNG